MIQINFRINATQDTKVVEFQTTVDGKVETPWTVVESSSLYSVREMAARLLMMALANNGL